MYTTQMARQAADFIREGLAESPMAGLILGSGLGMLADEVEQARVIPYDQIPYFPKSTVPGHEGKLVIGILEGIPVIVMQGRFHYYEGYGMDAVTFPIRVMKLLGVQDLIVTNAAGGCNKNFSPGDLMLITDHIKFFDESPLRGPNIDSFGPRFNDLSKAYTPSLQQKLTDAAGELGMELKTGVYAFMPGPSFETPAEIRMLSMLGADAVGMSTVPEVIVASHAGIRVLGISCITNMAAGILDQPLNHEEVIETGLKVRDRFAALIRGVLSQW